jgi:outer membrane protein TolC
VSPVATWLAPTGAQVQFTWTLDKTRGGGVTTGFDTGSLSVTQPLLRGGGTDVNLAFVRIARLQEQINRLTLKSTVGNTVTSVILAYRTLQQAQAQLRLAEDARVRSRSLLETNRVLISAGRMAAADLVQTEADVATQDVFVLQAEQARNSAQLALLQLLVIDLHTNVLANDAIKATHLTVPLERVIALGLDNRMDLLAQRKAVEQSRHNLIVAKNNRLWDLSIVGTLQKQRPVDGVALAGIGATTSSSIGLQLNIPIGDYTRPQSEIQATTSLRVSEVQLADLEQQVEAAIRDAVQGGELSWLQLVAAQRARTLAGSALDVARQKLQAGRASNFEVLSYEAALRAADVQALAATVTYLNALTNLDQQLGTTLDTWHITLND